MPRPPRPKPPGVTRRLEKFMRDYHKREQELDRQKAELREERDQAIRDAYQAGLLMQDIGKVVGLTHQRVSNIIRRGSGEDAHHN